MNRAQSHVVGVALLLAVSSVALGVLTLGVGELLESRAGNADAQRVAAGFDAAFQPTRTTGPRTVRVRFTEGRLSTARRDVRVYSNGSLVRAIPAGSLRFEAADRSVRYVGGAIVRGDGTGAWMARDPPVSGSPGTGVLIVGVAELGGGDVALGGGGGAWLPIATDVTHTRSALGTGEFAVAIETTAIAAFRRYFEAGGAAVRVEDIDGDGVPSVIGRYDGSRRGYIVRHTMDLEVGRG